jgi:hypothetical protein
MLAHYDRSSVPGPSFLGYGEVELLNPWWLEAEREHMCPCASGFPFFPSCFIQAPSLLDGATYPSGQVFSPWLILSGNMPYKHTQKCSSLIS